MKRKAWDITVKDNPNRVVMGENDDFYTTDTDAYLVFKLDDKDFNPTSAVLTLENRNDGSLKNETVHVVNGLIVWEMPQRYIEHFGNWQGQLIYEYTKYGQPEFYTSATFSFVVKAHIGDKRKPSLVEIENWEKFIREGTELIETWEDMEDLRQANESQRQQAELDRQAQEESRETAEGERNTAEVQRKADHANRSAEFDGKADKVVIENLVQNGDFSNGTTGWSSYGANIAVENNKGLKVTNDGNFSYAQVFGYVDLAPRSKYYFRTKFEVGNRDTNARLIDWFSGGVKSSEGLYGLVKENTSEETVRQQVKFTDSSTLGDYYYINNIQLINLTETFGAGNEPTKEEMDRLIEVIGYIGDEYALNNKEMLDYLMNSIREKADKVIYEYSPTLLSGYTSGSSGIEKIRIYKDSFGFVHISGRVEGSRLFGNSNPIFNVPAELRPLHVQAGAVCLGSSSSAFIGVRVVSNSGDCYFTSEPQVWTMVNVSYFAGL